MIKCTILVGLRRYGKIKTFAEILEERDILLPDAMRLSLAASLEELGLIHNTSYLLPVEIRSELTAAGEKIAGMITDE